MPSEIGHDHPQARVGQQRDHIDVAVDVVGETVQHQHGFTICRAGRVVGDVEHPSSHRFEGFKPGKARRGSGRGVRYFDLPARDVGAPLPSGFILHLVLNWVPVSSFSCSRRLLDDFGDLFRM